MHHPSYAMRVKGPFLRNEKNMESKLRCDD